MPPIAAYAVLGAATSAAAAAAAAATKAEVGDGEQPLANGVHQEARKGEGGRAQRAPRRSQERRLETSMLMQSGHVSGVGYSKPKL